MSISFSIFRAAVVVCAALGGPVWAAEPLTLPEAQRIAVERSQQLVAQNALAEAAREQAVAAGQLPDPVLKLGIDNLPANGPDRGSLTADFMTMRRVGIMQELPGAAKRQLKAERFEREALRVEAQRQLTQASVQRDATVAWLERFYTQTMRDLVQQQLAEARLQVQAAEVGFRAGRGGQVDVFAARSAVIQLEDRLSQTDRQLRNAELVLARWVGAAVAERVPTGTPQWQNTALQGADLSSHVSQHPTLQVMQAEIEAAQTEARLAEANKQADWSVEASYAQRGSAYSNMVSVGISIPLQWDQKNRQSRELSAKLAMVNEVQARYDDMLRQHEADVRVALNDWQTSKERVVRYQSELVPTAHQRAEAAQSTYRTGKGDLTATLAARRDETDARLQALGMELEAARAWTQLNFLWSNSDSPAAMKEQP